MLYRTFFSVFKFNIIYNLYSNVILSLKVVFIDTGEHVEKTKIIIELSTYFHSPLTQFQLTAHLMNGT